MLRAVGRSGSASCSSCYPVFFASRFADAYRSGMERGSLRVSRWGREDDIGQDFAKIKKGRI